MDINENESIIMSTAAEFLTAYERIKTSSKTALKEVDTAVGHEEQDRPLEAITAYETALRSINEIFTISVGLPDNIDAIEPEWHDACAIIRKLKSAKSDITHRLNVLRAEHAILDVSAEEAEEQNGQNYTAEIDEPLAKKKSMLLEKPKSSNVNGTSKSYKEIIDGLRHVIATEDSGVHFDTLFQAHVKLYKIEGDGVVSTLTGDTSMSLVMCTVSGEFGYLNSVCFIQCTIPTNDVDEVGNSKQLNIPMIWIYPLLPGETHCYRTNYGAFILPDIESNTPGSAFGLMLVLPSSVEKSELTTEEREEKLSDLQQFFLDLLEAVLSGTVEQLQPAPTTERPPRDTSQQVSHCIVTVADFVAHNLVRGAEKTGELMMKSTPYIISKLQPASPDTPPVSSTVQTSVAVAKNVTNAAVGVTGWVAGKVGAASLALGRYLGPHIQTHGAALLQKGFGYNSNEAHSKMEGAMTIAAGAVEGFTTVYDGLETSAKILGRNLSDNSVKIIEHKYGSSAGNVAAGTFDTLGNAFTVTQNVNYITPKGLAKKMAKNTGKAVVDDYKRTLRVESHFVPAAALYPDLRALKEKTD